MIRFIATAAVVILFLIFSIPILIWEHFYGKRHPREKDTSCLRIVQSVFRLCLRISGVDITVLGAENIPTDRAVLYVLNHRSIYDILLMYVSVYAPTGFVSKKELGRYPLLKNWMKNLHCLLLDRSDPKDGVKMLLDAIAKVQSGISIFICPEGTRSDTDEMLPFKDGCFKIATKTGCPVIPVALNHTSAIFEDQRPRVRKTHVVMEFGKPIETAGMSLQEKKGLCALSKAQIQKMIDKNSALV